MNNTTTKHDATERPDGFFQLVRMKTMAARLGVSLSMAHKLVDNGTLPSVRVGRVKAVRESDLLEYMESL